MNYLKVVLSCLRLLAPNELSFASALFHMDFRGPSGSLFVGRKSEHIWQRGLHHFNWLYTAHFSSATIVNGLGQ